MRIYFNYQIHFTHQLKKSVFCFHSIKRIRKLSLASIDKAIITN